MRETVLGVLDRDHDGTGPVVVVTLVASIRAVGEILVGRPVEVQTLDHLSTGLLVGLSQVLAFYALAYFLFSFLLSRCLSRRPAQVVVPVCTGIFIGILPPLIDGLASPGQVVTYSYAKGPAWLFVADYLPPGEFSVIWATIVMTTLFVLWVTRSAPRTLCALAGAWVAMQILGVWANLGLVAVLGDVPLQVVRVAFLGLALGVWGASRWRMLLPSLLRINHALPLAAITLAGSLWMGNPVSTTAVLVASMLCATLLLVVQNDWYDREQDAAGGRPSLVRRDDVVWSWFFLAVGALTLLVWSQMAALLVVAYVGVVSLYHLPGVRMKRIFCVSYKLEGLGGGIAFLLGALGDPQVAGLLPGRIVMLPALLAFGGQILVSGIKDWKDVEADGAARVYTYYTLASLRGGDPKRVHLWLSAASALALVSAPVLLGIWVRWSALVALTACLALVPPLWVVLVAQRRRAVEGFFWLLGGWLVVLALAMGSVSPVERRLDETAHRVEETTVRVIERSQTMGVDVQLPGDAPPGE